MRNQGEWLVIVVVLAGIFLGSPAEAQNKVPPSRTQRLQSLLVQGVKFSADWSLEQAAKIEDFFLAKFGHALPVSAMGQTAVHDRMKYDHRDALDVGLHPDSKEGRALIAYLRRSGIPFIAFRRKIAGLATGPHIHIGNRSPKLEAVTLAQADATQAAEVAGGEILPDH